ncbi:MAG: tyrosine-protein phosphatase [Anaerolineae bacterium]|nr:tyrosine-protein phosphatase [Anaerolineae bacterium]
MPWIVLGIVVVVGMVGVVAYIKLRGQRAVEQFSPESYLLPMDAAWSQGRDRTLGLKTAVNLRDIGGYPAAGGKRVRWGLVYRSGTLHELSAEDSQRLAELGLRLICDLRSDEELADAPDDAARFGAAYKHLPVQTERNTLQRVRAAMFQPERLSDFLRETYKTVMLEDNATLIGGILRDMLAPDGLPMLFHCTAGKDRTGVVAAVLLATLGVPDAVIAADYAQSNHFQPRFREYVGRAVVKLKWLGVSADSLHPLTIADGSMMHDMLATLRAKYHSIDDYLTQRAGLTHEEIGRLRALLLEEAV